MNKLSIAAAVAALSMLAAAACQSVQAHDESTFRFSSDDHQVRVRGEGRYRTFEVDGKRFDWSDLNDYQQDRIEASFERLEALEDELEIDTEAIEEWAEKMEAVAERMEDAVEGIEDLEFEFDSVDGTINLREFERMAERISEEMEGFETRMAEHEEQLRDMESNMPAINESVIRELEEEARELERTLVQIAAEI